MGERANLVKKYKINFIYIDNYTRFSIGGHIL